MRECCVHLHTGQFCGESLLVCFSGENDTFGCRFTGLGPSLAVLWVLYTRNCCIHRVSFVVRSEERRVGKECRN